MSIYALHVGLNKYPGGNALYKCVKDAMDLRQDMGFNGTLIVDKEGTQGNIVRAVNHTISQAGPGDWVVITYSGHGTQVRDRNGDEPDGWDEAMVDIKLRSLRDDLIYNSLIKLHKKARGWLISDSCFSGTQHRAVPLVGKAHLRKLRAENIRYLPPSMVKAGRAVTNQGPQDALARWVFTSGCTDFEFSYEGENNGVLTGALRKFYRSGISFAKLHSEINKEVEGWPQHPQLVCTANARRWLVPSMR